MISFLFRAWSGLVERIAGCVLSALLLYILRAIIGQANAAIADDPFQDMADGLLLLGGQLVAGDAAVFHTPVNDIGTESLEGELGGSLSYVFFHKDGEFGGGVGFRSHVQEGCIWASSMTCVKLLLYLVPGISPLQP